jgi:enamine deaminase RidA (YjgF/YER057c/UK114 family)
VPGASRQVESSRKSDRGCHRAVFGQVEPFEAAIRSLIICERPLSTGRYPLRGRHYNLRESEKSLHDCGLRQGARKVSTRDERLHTVAIELGFDLNEQIKVGGKYTPVLVEENVAYIAGQIPRIGEVVRFVGIVGESISLDEARRAAATSTVRALALAKNALGTLDTISAVPRVTVFVRSAPDFTMQSEVADGASDALYSILGDVGMHTRTSVGVLQLPKGASVEVDFIFKVRSRTT